MGAVRSMTGYGSSRFEFAGLTWLVELRSVNHRYLKLNFKIPSSLTSVQERLRKAVSAAVKRGAVDVIIRSAESNGTLYSINEAQIDRYERQLRERFPALSVGPEVLLALPGAATRNETVDEEEFAGALEAPLAEALETFERYRLEEGEALAADIAERCSTLARLVDDIAERASEVPREYARKLRERIAELMAEAGGAPEESAIAREAAFFADRADITEEIVRFRHHLQRLTDLLERGGTVGKEADFIVQEMNREANTMGAKCADVRISDDVISLKAELEKIREQVQNLE